MQWSVREARSRSTSFRLSSNVSRTAVCHLFLSCGSMSEKCAGKQKEWGILASHLAKIKNPAKIGKVASIVTAENDFVG